VRHVLDSSSSSSSQLAVSLVPSCYAISWRTSCHGHTAVCRPQSTEEKS